MHLDSLSFGSLPFCVLCQEGIEETAQHLFLDCPFARNCWSPIGITVQGNQTILTAIDQIRAQSHTDFFMMVIILMSRAIWTVRNDFIFLRSAAKHQCSSSYLFQGNEDSLPQGEDKILCYV